MSLDMGMLIAGAKLQGEFEDRLIQARPALAALAA
jgi:ATP-dependent Clp protease ATP-binding subunit ClpA